MYNNTSSRRKKVNYVFGDKRNEEVVDNITFSNYYQICTYKDPTTNSYHLRKFVISSKNEFEQMNEYRLTKKQLKKFIENKKKHEYKCYPSYNFNNIDYPNLGDIHMANSSILSGNSDYTGYAPF